MTGEGIGLQGRCGPGVFIRLYGCLPLRVFLRVSGRVNLWALRVAHARIVGRRPASCPHFIGSIMETEITFTRGIDAPGYLGKFEVVDGLVRQFVGKSMAAECDFSVTGPAAAHLGIAFAGADPGYRPVPGFKSMETLGRDIHRYLGVSDTSGELHIVVATAAMEMLRDIVRAVNADEGEEKLKQRTDWLIERFVAVLLGNGAAMPPEPK